MAHAAASASAAPATSLAAPSSAPTKPAPRPCGALDCLAFATPQAAFEYVLQSAPRVLAIGEAHAQDGTGDIHSSTRRFAEQLLPMLAGKSKHIVIELLLANCKQATVSGVAKQQAPVTEHQAKGDQSEFLTLGKVARGLGIEPQALAPDCAEYESVIAAGDDAVARLLGLVAETTTKQVEALLARPETAGEIVLTYGGALHNDLYPQPGQEAWSFGPKLAADSAGRYVELDLIVPEFVKDSEAWRKMPWFQAFDRDHLSDEALLYRPAPNSFALIFPKTSAKVAQGL
ncbi:MAG TPA: hypothetical protein VHW01_18130 [Polyangiaceae bacterium]|nr:hypothetical protein [Polyangiaceae bacterium]